MNPMLLVERIKNLSPRQREELLARIAPGTGSEALRLVAHVRARPGRNPDVESLTRFLRERLPEFMIPTAFVALHSFPLTTNGKVDRHALPEPEWHPDTAPQPAASDNPAHAKIAAIWQEVLHIPRPGIHDHFFRVGGHSLAALQVLRRIKSEFGVDLPLRAIFNAPTIARLAETIARAPRATKDQSLQSDARTTFSPTPETNGTQDVRPALQP